MNHQHMNSSEALMLIFAAWIGWFSSHLKDINDVLQFFVLLLAAASSIAAIRYHTRKPRK